ncbi:hypothetical protein [Mucilaginibacter dorajii]|uniref:SMODS-associating 2TM beta-strand rich effector domain-containing protein n=1 Tax=Mucilaginibacter dorajii TaxID=692994 RepID=A0ABP7Q1C3_9SPHI|nr:hypothetical protein [Mucilaginibacter dorajii]MCS3732855.1 hypothetical protein [Mucilaginibacter dorajii]
MKKSTIITAIIIVVSLLYLAWVFYVDSTLKIQSVYWLRGKLAGMAIMYVVLIINLYYDNDRTKLSKTASACILLFWPIVYGYREISKYNRYVCQDQFGLIYNKVRQKLGTPQIPANWEIEYRTDYSVTWRAKDTTIGHQIKRISIDSACRVLYEDDDYKLGYNNSDKSSMLISTRYTHGKGGDSIFYYYNPGDSSRLISKQKADSIFAAKKINRDY